MNVSKRLKEARKELGLSQSAFGARISVSRDVINNAENGRVPPSTMMIKAISNEFSISEEWLLTGDGEKFSHSKSDLLTSLASEYNLDDIDVSILETYLNLPAESKSVFKSFILAASTQKKQPAKKSEPPQEDNESETDITLADIQAFLDKKKDHPKNQLASEGDEG